MAELVFVPFGGGGGGGQNNTGANVGSGPGESFRDKTGVTLNFRTIQSSDDSLAVATAGDEIDLKIDASPENVGDGVEIYDDTVGPGNLPWKFKTLTSEDDSVTITDNGDEVDFSTNAPKCMPMLSPIGAAGGAGAQYTADVDVLNGGSSDVRGIYLGGIFSGLKNLAEDSGDDITLVVVEDPSDSNVHLRLAYRNDADGQHGRLVFIQNSNEVFSVPAQIDTHPTIIAGVLAPAGDSRTVSLVVGSSVIGQESMTDFGWPVGDTMRVRVGQSVGGGDVTRSYQTGGVFMGVPNGEFDWLEDAVALALENVALSGNLKDITTGLLAAQAWVADALEEFPDDPWQELNDGTELERAVGEPPTYAPNCTPAWAPAQMPASGVNLGNGAAVYKPGSAAGKLQHRTLVSSDFSVAIAQDDDEIDLKVDPSANRAFGTSYFSAHTPWQLPAAPEQVGDLVTTPSGLGESFDENVDGSLTYTGLTPKTFLIHATISIERASGIDADGSFWLAVGDPGSEAIVAGSKQVLRFALTGSSEVIDLQALVELEEDQRIEVWADTTAPGNGVGLTVQIVGFTISATEA